MNYIQRFVRWTEGLLWHDNNMQPSIVKKRLLTSAISAPLAMAALTFILLWHLRTERVYTQWLDHSDRVLNGIRVAQGRILAEQAAFDGYMASSDRAYLNDFQAALQRSRASLDRLGTLFSDNPYQESRLIELNNRERLWTAEMNRALASLGPGSDRAQSETVLKQVRSFAKPLFASFDDMIGIENQIRDFRLKRRDSEELLVLWMVPVSATGVALILILVSWREVTAVVREYESALRDSEEANLRTNNFLATVSHELRNPLNLILLWSRLLLTSERTEEKTVRGLNAIDRAAQAQAQLIEDLLEVGKIESGRLRLDLQPTDLPPVVRAAVDTTMAAAEAKSIELQVIIDPRAGMILGDPQRLQQALWNILSNALKATPKGGMIRIQLSRINSHIELSVSDTGRGIEPALLPHVFDRFFQVDSGTDSNRKGMGLGLTIVKHIIAMHGGSVTAHSEGIGKGATFTLRLPLPTAPGGFQDERGKRLTVAGVVSSTRIPRLTGFEMLVVDDDHEATEALKALLKSLGANVLVAGSADRALEILAEHRPDVVVSDIGMPGRDGLDLAREIRSREQNGHGSRLPLVALTAYGRVEDKVEIFAAGFDSHVVKPVDPAELAAVIKGIVGHNRDRLLV